MTDREIADKALDAITLAAGDGFEQWSKIAMGYKAAAGDDGADYFDAWNRRQPNNRGARDLADYKRLTPDGGIGLGTLIQIAKGYGYKPDGGTFMQKSKNIEPKDQKPTTIPRPRWDEYNDGDKIFKSTALHITNATASRREQRRNYLNSIFCDGDRIAVAKYRCRDTAIFTFGELMEWAQIANEADPATSARVDLSGLQDGEKEKGGLFICTNPTNNEGRNDADVVQFRQTLIETDDTNLTADAQIDILKKSGIPIMALTATGGKSMHAIVYIGAGADRELYNTRVNYLHRYLFERFGFLADPADKNPARLTRMAGFLRWDNDGKTRAPQRLIATGTADYGDPWASFFEQAEAVKTTAPAKSFLDMTPEEIERIKDAATLDKAGEPKQREAAKNELDKIIKADREKRQWLHNDYLTPATLLTAMAYYRDNPPIKTGLTSLDNLLNGGILGDFYVLGGTSGMGKTTLSLQIATALARAGYYVFYYTFEQDVASLTAKILAQFGAGIVYEEHGRAGLYREKTASKFEAIGGAKRAEEAPTTRGILINGGKGFKQKERETFDAAVEKLEKIKTLYIRQADRNYTAQKIADDMTMAGEEFGTNKCILFVDYLQKVPFAAGLTDKQALDNTTATLHEISRKNRIPVFTLSSLNRESYKGETARAAEVTLASFKESGGIEYDTDVAIGLQADGNTAEERKNRLATLHGAGSIFLRTTLLKSRRGGKLGEHASLEFFPEYDFFITAENETTDGNSGE